ncbi:MAG: aspartyl/asparaginyl beta-hydroxylase domain-containing protein [Flavobacteriales bacterium]|nr:aspartyl/asparaginyl beta-hydroxylase domain-containing protein [Flavobacteriales bacterium]
MTAHAMTKQQPHTQPYPWFSYHGPYHGDSPFYYNEQDYDWVKTIEDNFETIRHELFAFLENRKSTIDPYFNVDLVGGENYWKVGTFYFWGKRNDENCDQVPELEKILTSIPGFVSAGLSILEGNTSIKAHQGDTDASIRGHLGLKIPAELPDSGFEVGNIQKSWKEGKVFLFSDAQDHRAWNNSSEKRYILIFDIIRPEFLDQQEDICKNAHSLIALQQLEYKMPIVKKLPGKFRGLIRRRLKSRLQ